jgi:hypothetical protein
MNLSIFSSKKESWVIVGVVVVLLLCEVLVRRVSDRLSIDIAHIHELPAIAKRLRDSKPVRVLFLGNSLTRAGVDLEIIRQTVQPSMSNGLTAESIHPDDTTIGDWYYVYRSVLVDRQVAPELVVVGYVLRQLEDSSQLHMGRLGGYFAGWSGLHEAFRSDVFEVGDRIQYLLASVSSVFANQERIRERLLGFIVPYYGSSAQFFNRGLRRLNDQRDKKHTPSYTRLKRFIRLVRTNGTKLVFVAMPLPESYPIPDLLRESIEAEGGLLLDMRKAGLSVDAFPDRYHLSSSGAKSYSSALAANLSTLGFLVNRP